MAPIIARISIYHIFFSLFFSLSESSWCLRGCRCVLVHICLSFTQHDKHPAPPPMGGRRDRRPGAENSPSLQNTLHFFTLASLIINLSKVKVNLLPVSQDELLSNCFPSPIYKPNLWECLIHAAVDKGTELTQGGVMQKLWSKVLSLDKRMQRLDFSHFFLSPTEANLC